MKIAQLCPMWQTFLKLPLNKLTTPIRQLKDFKATFADGTLCNGVKTLRCYLKTNALTMHIFSEFRIFEEYLKFRDIIGEGIGLLRFGNRTKKW